MSAKPAVQHIQNTKYENDLKEALGYGTPRYFYSIFDVLEKLKLSCGEEFRPRYGDVAFLVSNQPLTDEQLRTEVEVDVGECDELDSILPPAPSMPTGTTKGTSQAEVWWAEGEQEVTRLKKKTDRELDEMAEVITTLEGPVTHFFYVFSDASIVWKKGIVWKKAVGDEGDNDYRIKVCGVSPTPADFFMDFLTRTTGVICRLQESFGDAHIRERNVIEVYRALTTSHGFTPADAIDKIFDPDSIELLNAEKVEAGGVIQQLTEANKPANATK